MSASGWHRKARTQAELTRRKQYASREHREQKAQGEAAVATGCAVCWRCHRPISPDADWHVGHDDYDRTVYRGPEHAACNVKAAAAKGARMVNARHKELPTVRRRRLL